MRMLLCTKLLLNYKIIKTLFHNFLLYNGVLIASDGLDGRVGSLTAPWERFVAWKSPEDKKEGEEKKPQMEIIVNEMLQPTVLFDLIKSFVVFEKIKNEDKETGLITVETIKKLAAYHQYYLVKKAVVSTVEATRENGNRKIGVAWHTQGSGKSLSMVFYYG